LRCSLLVGIGFGMIPRLLSICMGMRLVLIALSGEL
jgi:hypothetical protein